MTRIDFYVLESQRAAARYHFACRLAEKAWQQGKRVYIHTSDAEQSRRLDELLWTFRAGSFLPHSLNDEAMADKVPVHIGHEDAPHHHEEVLINLAPEVPLFFSRFGRVIELVDEDEQCRRQGRERFRFYRDRGYPLASHNIHSGQG